MADAPNHRELLKKYMALVADEEGVTFVEMAKWNTRTGLTDQDLYELRVIEEELEAERDG
jgi:hypothetical protein